MSNMPIKMEEVRYNGATGAFEATVTVFGPRGARNYACEIPAPITMSFADAAEGLATQAQRRYAGRGGLVSRPVVRTPDLRAVRRPFDPSSWLREVIGRFDRDAA